MHRVAIAGAGFGLTVHCPAITAAGGQVVALADSGSGNAREAAHSLGAKYFSSWEDMLLSGGFDIVVVAMPPALHFQTVSRALELKYAVFCEKPCGLNLEQVIEMERLREKHRGEACVGFQFRYDSGLIALKNKILSGDIGSISNINIEWLTSGRSNKDIPFSFQNSSASGGGVANSFASHVIDYLGWLTGGTIANIASHTEIYQAYRKGSDELIHKVTAEDSINFICRISKILVSVTIGNCVHFGSGHHVTLFGEAGRVELKMKPPFNLSDKTLISVSDDGEIVHNLSQEKVEIDSRLEAVTRLWRAFFKRIRDGNATNIPNFKDAVNVHKVLDKIHSSNLIR